jgi:hypothetical protein
MRIAPDRARWNPRITRKAPASLHNPICRPGLHKKPGLFTALGFLETDFLTSGHRTAWAELCLKLFSHGLRQCSLTNCRENSLIAISDFSQTKKEVCECAIHRIQASASLRVCPHTWPPNSSRTAMRPMCMQVALACAANSLIGMCRSSRVDTAEVNPKGIISCPGDGTGIHACLRHRILGVRISPGAPQTTGCNVSQVDGLFWKQEAAGSKPATQTSCVNREAAGVARAYLAFKHRPRFASAAALGKARDAVKARALARNATPPSTAPGRNPKGSPIYRNRAALRRASVQKHTSLATPCPVSVAGLRGLCLKAR